MAKTSKKNAAIAFCIKRWGESNAKIDKVTKEFPQSSGGRKRVHEDISLKIEDNEFVCILGKSGCGKSTLLNLLAGYTVPDYGALYLDKNMIHGGGLYFRNTRYIRGTQYCRM